MTYRLRLARTNALKIKAATRIPAQLEGGTAIDIARLNGTYTFDWNLSGLAESLVVDDASEAVTFFPIWNEFTDVYTVISLTNLKADIVASFDEVYASESITLTAGAGLTGGGDLSANRSFAVGAGSGITVNADDVALDTASTRNTDHTSVTLSAGAGLTGGGDISASRSFAVGAGSGITVNADDVALDTSSTRNTDHTAVTLSAGAGLTGGGDISASRSFAVGAGAGITVNADDVALDTSSNRNVDHTGVILTAGAGLTGGGDISANRSFAVGAGTGIAVNADDVALAAIADDRLLANISGVSAAPSANTLTAILDSILGTTQGAIVTRNASGWTKLDPGTSGHFLKSQGAAADLIYDAVPGGGDMLAANNLSDVANTATAFGNIKQAATTSATGVVEIATTAEMATGTDTARVPSVQAVRDGTGAGWASFSAHKNGTAQTGIADVTYTQITFGTEVYDVGGFFASNAWTPPAGKVHITGGLLFSGAVTTGNLIIAAIYKNGATFKETWSLATTASGSFAVAVNAYDTANGTDVYTLYGYIDTSSGTGSVNGGAQYSFFQGSMVN